MHVHIRSQVARHDLIYKENARKPPITDVEQLYCTVYSTMRVSNSACTNVIICHVLKEHFTNKYIKASVYTVSVKLFMFCCFSLLDMTSL